MRRSMILVALGMLLVACGGGGPEGVEGNRPPLRTPTESPSPSPEEECPAQTTLVMNTRSFDPICLEVAKGATLRLENNSNVPHTFTLDKPKVDVVVPPGESGEYEVTDLKRKEYRFHCRYHLVMVVDVVVT
jgi:plastocyanin